MDQLFVHADDCHDKWIKLTMAADLLQAEYSRKRCRVWELQLLLNSDVHILILTHFIIERVVSVCNSICQRKVADKAKAPCMLRRQAEKFD